MFGQKLPFCRRRWIGRFVARVRTKAPSHRQRERLHTLCRGDEWRRGTREETTTFQGRCSVCGQRTVSIRPSIYVDIDATCSRWPAVQHNSATFQKITWFLCGRRGKSVLCRWIFVRTTNGFMQSGIFSSSGTRWVKTTFAASISQVSLNEFCWWLQWSLNHFLASPPHLGDVAASDCTRQAITLRHYRLLII